ncbi:hypothetical protein [Acidiphilium acidophilum]|uniref:hypothetical protein n=1 Tax=Acidiphilium acidophilum TaxID=76588 RepID=UPI002E8E70B3|nr:hypothetical protein [Acidiphilium acidophilum]
MTQVNELTPPPFWSIFPAATQSALVAISGTTIGRVLNATIAMRVQTIIMGRRASSRTALAATRAPGVDWISRNRG